LKQKAADVKLLQIQVKKEEPMTTSTATIEPIKETLYLAFELGWGKWRLAFTVGRAQRPRLRSIEARDIEAVRREIREAKKRFGLSRKAHVVSCYEAGRDGFWLSRFLEANGVQNLVVDSASIEVSRRKRRPKTDRLDANKLVMMLIRWAEGEKKVWSVVSVPSQKAEDARHLHRELKTLKRERTRINNRIKGLLAGHGISIGKISGDFREWLSKVQMWDGSPLPPRLGQRVLVEHDRYCYVKQQVLAVERERKRLTKEGRGRDAVVARKLLELRAVGDNTAWTYSTELFSWRKFDNRKQVGSTAGLTGTPYDSGASDREQGIDKAGSKVVRAVAVEFAWGWLRFQPKSALSLWYQKRFAHGGKRLRKIGIVAMARKLLIAMWRWVEQGILPEGAVLKA
jgi:transposase